MTYSRIPSVVEIRVALEDIPGAIRDDPLPEDVREGTERATPIWSPDGGLSSAQAVDMPDSADDDGDAFNDEPGVIFEVPPALTDAEIRNVLGDEEIGNLKRLEQVRGIDALGWYMTFHQRRYQHGIYIPIKGILYLAIGALAGLSVDVERKIELAFHAILRHELFHFATDCMTANWELATAREVYWKAKAARRNASGYVELEEALANAYMLRGFKWPTQKLKAPGGYSALGKYCELQPAGYKLGPTYARKQGKYVEKSQQLSIDYQNASVTDPKLKAPNELDGSRLYPDITRIAWQRCPIFILDEHDLLGLLGIRLDLFASIPTMTETDGFRDDFDKLQKPIQAKWVKCRRMLEQENSTAVKGLDFKRWKPGGDDCYSVRVDLKHRAHLLYDRTHRTWSAIEIGNHKDMGHG